VIRTQPTRLWILAALFVLTGLLTTVPVNCVCDADDHLGQLVHPIFAHDHGSGVESASAHNDASVAQQDELSARRTVIEQSSPLLAAVSAGVALPWGPFDTSTLLTLLFFGAALWIVRRPAEFLHAPPSSPPRIQLLPSH
jgi:hypothetical protein